MQDLTLEFLPKQITTENWARFQACDSSPMSARYDGSVFSSVTEWFAFGYEFLWGGVGDRVLTPPACRLPIDTWLPMVGTACWAR